MDGRHCLGGRRWAVGGRVGGRHNIGGRREGPFANGPYGRSPSGPPTPEGRSTERRDPASPERALRTGLGPPASDRTDPGDAAEVWRAGPHAQTRRGVPQIPTPPPPLPPSAGPELAERRLDRHFPRRNGTHEHLIRLPDCGPGVPGEPSSLVPPDEHVGVQEEVHSLPSTDREDPRARARRSPATRTQYPTPNPPGSGLWVLGIGPNPAVPNTQHPIPNTQHPPLPPTGVSCYNAGLTL